MITLEHLNRIDTNTWETHDGRFQLIRVPREGTPATRLVDTVGAAIPTRYDGYARTIERACMVHQLLPVLQSAIEASATEAALFHKTPHLR